MRSDAVNLEVDPLERRFGVVSKQLGQCDQHGPFASIISKNSDKPSGCPGCSEAEKSRIEHDEYRAAQAKAAAARLAETMGAALIPKRFQGKSFDQFKAASPKQARALAACVDYATNFRDNAEAGRCLLLLGKPGTGKTHLASAIADHVIRNNSASAVYRTVSGLLSFVKGSYDQRADYTEADAMASFIKPDLLIIDEVGATKQTEFEQAILFQVINGRYEEQLPTIVVSNLDPKDLPAALGDRCVDRLREGGGIALVFDWKSVRSEVSLG